MPSPGHNWQGRPTGGIEDGVAPFGSYRSPVINRDAVWGRVS